MDDQKHLETVEEKKPNEGRRKVISFNDEYCSFRDEFMYLLEEFGGSCVCQLKIVRLLNIVQN